jgi:hypothetical protein
LDALATRLLGFFAGLLGFVEATAGPAFKFVVTQG